MTKIIKVENCQECPHRELYLTKTGNHFCGKLAETEPAYDYNTTLRRVKDETYFEIPSTGILSNCPLDNEIINERKSYHINADWVFDNLRLFNDGGRRILGVIEEDYARFSKTLKFKR